MPALVNVEDLKFEELIPLLKENDHIKDHISDLCSFEEICDYLEAQFIKLQRGEDAEHYVIGLAMVECLDKMGRLFKWVTGAKDDFMIVPVTKNELIRFINRIIHNER